MEYIKGIYRYLPIKKIEAPLIEEEVELEFLDLTDEVISNEPPVMEEETNQETNEIFFFEGEDEYKPSGA